MATINSYENLPLITLINQLSINKAKMSTEPVTSISVNELKEELLKKNLNGERVYSILLKEDDDLLMLYYNNIPHELGNENNDITNLESSCRSIILDKQNLKPIVTQYNKILYNKDSLDFIKKKDQEWNKFVIQKCLEGTLIVVFNHNNKWYVTTRRCLNAQDSTWIKNNSYYDMFMEAMGQNDNSKFTFDQLDKTYCYHFVLVHHKNRNIVSYSTLGREYKELYHILTTEKYSLNEVSYKINDKVKYIEEEKFDSIDHLLSELTKQNDMDRKYQKVTTEGYILRYYSGELYKSPFVTLKLQTEIYDILMKLKPNNSNIYQCFLELYQKDQLNDFLPYFTRYGNEVIKRIHISIQNMSKEMLDLYHMTRNKNNGSIYTKMTEQYKKCLYELHGLYIKNRKQDFENGIDAKKNGSTKSINVFDVYHYLKNIPSNELRQLYFDRNNFVNNPEFKFINNTCINTTTQSTLMFKNSQSIKSVSH